MIPPRYSPSLDDHVVGHRGAEVDDHARAADLLVAGDGVDEPVGADLVRVVVADRHPGPQPRARPSSPRRRGTARPSRCTPAAAAGRSRRRSSRRASRGACRAARAGCAAPRRARRRSTRARWRSASAGRARRPGRCRGASGCCRRRRRGAWARHIRLAPPWPRPSTPSPPRIRARRWRRRSSSRASSTAGSTSRRSPTRPCRRRCSAAGPCRACGSTAARSSGSREIMRALDDAVPEPPLLPADEKERKSVGAGRAVGRRGAAADGAADHLGGAAALAGVDGVLRRRLLAPDPRRGHPAHGAAGRARRAEDQRRART